MAGSPGGTGRDPRKAAILLAVAAAHLLLFSVRFPQTPRPGQGRATPPVSVTLVPLPPLRPAARAEPPSAPPGPRPRPVSRRGMRNAPDVRPESQPPSTPEAAADTPAALPPARLGLAAAGRVIAPLRMPPTLAEQARARSGEAA